MKFSQITTTVTVTDNNDNNVNVDLYVDGYFHGHDLHIENAEIAEAYLDDFEPVDPKTLNYSINDLTFLVDEDDVWNSATN